MDNLAVANRFFTALLEGDGATLEELFTADATFWQNASRVVQPRDEFLPRWGGLATAMEGLRMEDVQRRGIPTGFVEQHTLCGRAPSGKDFAIRGCFIATVVDGKIARLQEYVDSAHMAAFGPRAAS